MCTPGASHICSLAFLGVRAGCHCMAPALGHCKCGHARGVDGRTGRAPTLETWDGLAVQADRWGTLEGGVTAQLLPMWGGRAP